MRIIALIFILFLAKSIHAQDSTTAVYINDLVGKIQGRLSTDILERKDTTIYSDGDSLQLGPALTVHTEFFTDPRTMLLDKIVEKSLYKKITTELTIYFFGNQPVFFNNKQWEGSMVKVDFDIYYMNDNSVYSVKRSEIKGTPDGAEYLKWCYQLKKEYLTIVNDYNRMYARRQGRLK